MTYIKDLAERTVATFAAAALSVIGADVVNIVHVDWPTVLGVGAGAAVVSLLKGLAGKTIGNTDSASTVPAVGAGQGRHEAAESE